MLEKAYFRRKNRKPKYQRIDGLFPLVRLRDANGRSYPAADRFLAGVVERIHKAAREREATRNRVSASWPSSPLRDIENFRQNPTYAGDGTRIDLAHAIYALPRGATPAEIEGAIRSRNLTHKGSDKRQNEYVERTIKKDAHENFRYREPATSRHYEG